jgi:hypothetical protein
VRELLVSLPRSEVEAAFDPTPVVAEVVAVLSGDDPRF